MYVAIILLGVAAVLGSGILFEHRRIFTFLAVAGVLWEAAWLLLTFFDRVLFLHLDRSPIFIFGSIVLLSLTLVKIKEWQLPYNVGPGSGRRDFMVILALLPVLVSAWFIVDKNGFVGADWITYGFYNGDTVTLVSLTQRSFLETGLVSQNIFSGGEALEYPTLFHAALATLLQGIKVGMDWLRYLPVMTFVQIVITVPLFFLLWDILFPEPGRFLGDKLIDSHKRWFGIRNNGVVLISQVIIVWYVLGMSWSGYIFPQTHFFLTGLFLVGIGLLINASKKSGRAVWQRSVPALIIFFILLMSNAVTGTAALTIALVWSLKNIFDRQTNIASKITHSILTIAWLMTFFALTPGEAELGWPKFAYTAGEVLINQAPSTILLAIAVWWYLKRQSFLVASIVSMGLLAAVTFLTSHRAIVVENSERFLYHGLLIGFPLMLAPLITGWHFLSRLLRRSSLTFTEQTAGWAMLAVLLLVVGTPALATTARAQDSLLNKDRRVIASSDREMSWWINENSSKDAIFMANPDSPWYVPFLTGRALLRSDYWLSEKDDLDSLMLAAFINKEVKAIQTVKQCLDGSIEEIVCVGVHTADYMVLRADERELWEPLNFRKVFDTNAIVAYDLRESAPSNPENR